MGWECSQKDPDSQSHGCWPRNKLALGELGALILARHTWPRDTLLSRPGPLPGIDNISRTQLHHLFKPHGKYISRTAVIWEQDERRDKAQLPDTVVLVHRVLFPLPDLLTAGTHSTWLLTRNKPLEPSLTPFLCLSSVPPLSSPVFTLEQPATLSELLTLYKGTANGMSPGNVELKLDAMSKTLDSVWPSMEPPLLPVTSLASQTPSDLRTHYFVAPNYFSD